MEDLHTIRAQEGFYEKLASYIDQGLHSGQIYRRLGEDFPNATLPRCVSGINTWLSTRKTWQTFVDKLGRERTEVLWAKHQSRLRVWLGRRHEPQSLDQMLGLAPPDEVQPRFSERLRYG